MAVKQSNSLFFSVIGTSPKLAASFRSLSFRF